MLCVNYQFLSPKGNFFKLSSLTIRVSSNVSTEGNLEIIFFNFKFYFNSTYLTYVVKLVTDVDFSDSPPYI